MRDSPLGKEAGHGEVEDKVRADRDAPAANRSGHREWGRLWLADGSCVRLRPERARHVWSYDFVSATTHDGRTLRLLTLIDEYTRECLAILVARHLGSHEV